MIIKHYQSYAPFFRLDNSRPTPSPPAPTICEITITLSFGTSLVNGLRSTHVYSPKISDYSHAWSTYHMFSFPCHTFVSFIPHATFIIPDVISKSSTCSLPFVTYYVSDLQYISIKYLSCIFLSFEYQTSSPSFLTLSQKSNLSVQNQGHIGDRRHNTYIEA